MSFARLFRDTSAGQLLRVITRNRVLRYEDESNPEIWKHYVDEKKSGYMAHHGTTEPCRTETDDDSAQGLGGVRTREGIRRASSGEKEKERNSTDSGANSARAAEEGVAYNEASGVKIGEKGKDINMVDFLPNDPDNPKNWSTAKKFFVTFEICFLTFSIYIGSAIYTPGVMTVEESFGVGPVAATLGLTLFVAGYGLGPMIWSPLSEIPQIGRNPIYISTLLVFVLLQIPTALASNFGMLLAFRFITGFFGSPVLATGGASITDMYSPRKQAYAMAIWGISAVCGPVLGPLIGGFAAQVYGWTWTIWELMWLSGVAWVFLFFLLPETSANNILVRRTQRLRKHSGNDKLRSQPEIMSEEMTPRAIVMMALVRPFTLNFTEPMVFLLNLYIALVYGLLYIWFESFPIVFVEIYNFNLGELGLAFLGILVGALLTIPPFFWYLYKNIEPKFNEEGKIRPEERLKVACFGSFFIPICLFWFGWSSRPSIHWIMPIIGSSFFSVAALLLFNSVLNYLPDAYPEYAASVLAGNDLFRSSFGAGFPLFARAMYMNLGVGWASSLLAFLGVAFIPIPFVLYKYGGQIRKKSKHASKDF